jgi:uncharacterized membrane protein YgcG
LLLYLVLLACCCLGWCWICLLACCRIHCLLSSVSWTELLCAVVFCFAWRSPYREQVYNMLETGSLLLLTFIAVVASLPLTKGTLALMLVLALLPTLLLGGLMLSKALQMCACSRDTCCARLLDVVFERSQKLSDYIVQLQSEEERSGGGGSFGSFGAGGSSGSFGGGRSGGGQQRELSSAGLDLNDTQPFLLEDLDKKRPLLAGTRRGESL